MNFVRGRLRRGDAAAWIEANDGTRLPNGSQHSGQDGQEVVYSFRPEQLTLGAAGQGVPAKILLIEPTGAGTHVYCEFCATQICAVFGERLAFKAGRDHLGTTEGRSRPRLRLRDREGSELTRLANRHV